MTPSPHDEEKLAQAIHRTLRDLPPRPAPRSLELRVLAELARRAALPWWRHSFSHWPAAARATFCVASAGVIKLVLMATVWVMAGFDPAQFQAAFAPQFTWMENGFAVVQAIAGFVEIVLRNIPTLWLYGGLAFVAILYVALFGLGAAAYRVLYVRR